MRPLPLPAALAVVVAGGVASAAQGAVNAGMGERTGAPVLGAVVNNLGGCLLVLAGIVALPSMRAGLAGLRRSGLPWWTYLGGVGGAVIVLVAPVVVPVLGVAVFTIAQVAGGSLGGLAVDRAGLAATGHARPVAPALRGRAGPGAAGARRAGPDLVRPGRPHPVARWPAACRPAGRRGGQPAGRGPPRRAHLHQRAVA